MATYPIGPLALLLLWHFCSTRGIVNPVFLPPPGEVGERLLGMVEDGSLIQHLRASLIRVGGGFFLAATSGILLGLIMGRSKIAARLFGPIIELLRPISPIAWIPLAILWFGLGNGTAWFVIFLAAFFPIVINTYKGVTSVAQNDLRAAACCGIRGVALARLVVLPSALPDIMAGLRIGLGIAWMAVIAAELVAAQSGLGYLIERSRQTFDPGGVLVGMVTIGVVGLLVNGLMEQFENRMTAWKRAQGVDSGKPIPVEN